MGVLSKIRMYVLYADISALNLFWNNYNTCGPGVAYKPCVIRVENSHRNFHIGGSRSSDRHHVLGGIHVGYEHNYFLCDRWKLFWRVKSDLMIECKVLFQIGVVIGLKLPTR